MAYSDYTTLQKLNNELGIAHKRQKLFMTIQPVLPSEKLLEDLQEAQNYYSLTTEKAQSEFLITPILREVKRTHVNQVGVFSGVNLDLPTAGLNRTLEEGFAQCAAEMYAAILFNEQDQQPTSFMYGCVTNGYEWCFLRLENKMIQIDAERFFLNDLKDILGIFQIIIDSDESE